MLSNLPYIITAIRLLIFITLFFPLVGTAQWTSLSSGTTEILNEIIFPAPDTGYVVGANGTLLRTFTGGDQWTALDIGTTQHLHDIYFLNTQTGFVVGDSGLIASTINAGEHWSTTYLETSARIDLSSVCFTSLLTGYIGGRRDAIDGIIFKTTDGGITWVETDTPESLLDGDYKRIVFPTPDTGYALTRGMCIKTTDGGDHWFVTDTTLVASGDMFSILEDAYFFSADTGYIVGWYNGFSGYTVNGGEQWTDQFVANNQWHSIDFPSRQTGYLVGWGQLMKTSDGGQTWEDGTTALIANGSIYSAAFTDEETGYMCGAGGVILKTTNGGITQSKDFRISADLQILPNPSDGLVYISMNDETPDYSEEISVRVYSMLGDIVWESPALTLPADIHLWDLPQGVYVVVAETKEVQYVQKLILH